MVIGNVLAWLVGEFIVGFEKRAKEAVQYNPRDTNSVHKSEKTPIKIPGHHKTRLLELKLLFDEGIITEAEYKQKRQSIFDEL